MPEITGVLLAAGQSQRFGSNKLLAKINNRALVLHAAASLSPCDRLLAVVRRDDLDLQQLLRDASIDLVINDKADRGMGSSISCGIAASRYSHGWCLLPADMPFVKQATTLDVIAALKQGATLAAPFYQGRRGHPVGFGHDLTSELLALDNGCLIATMKVYCLISTHQLSLKKCYLKQTPGDFFLHVWRCTWHRQHVLKNHRS
jgi:molybdenum cofactor cytidylyltransferase